MNKEECQSIKVVYLGDAEDPTIRFVVECEEALLELRCLIARLANGEQTCIKLHKNPLFQFPGTLQLEFEVFEQEREGNQLLFLIHLGPEGVVFHYRATLETWKQNHDRLNGLDSPGHQYLSEEYRDEATIEISYIE